MSAAGLVLLSHSLAASLFLVTLRDLSSVRARRLEELRSTSHWAGQPRDGRGGTPVTGSTARLHSALGGAFIVVGQSLALTTKTALPARQYAEAVGVLALVAAALVVLPLCRPRLFARLRPLLAGAVRLLMFVQPVVRHPRGMLTVLEGAPSDSPAGPLLDVWRLLLGSRSVAMLVTPLACPLPALPSLALQALALHRCHQVDQMCAGSLLQHPIWQGRIAWAHRIVRKLPMLVLDPPGDCGAGTPEAAAQRCRVFVTFVQLMVGVVAPLATMAAVRAPVNAAAADAAARRELQRRRREASRPPPEDDDGGGKWPWVQACWAGVCSLYLQVDSVAQHLGELLGSTRHGVVSAAAWWLTASLCWVQALLLEQ